MMSSIAIIPARGGSKGLPRKNVRLLAGKPLIAHTIEAALAARSLSRVVVSTDDAEIQQVAERHGADVVVRPAALSGDAASSESALLHTLEEIGKRDGQLPELLVFLQCTSPLTLPEDIDGTVDALLTSGADSALAVSAFHGFLWKFSDGEAIAVNHDKHVRLPRQQGERQYRETGAVYVMRTAGFLAARHRFFGRTAMYVMPPERCHDIDDAVDFVIAETLLRNREGQDGVQPGLVP